MSEEVKEDIETIAENNEMNSVYERILRKEDAAQNTPSNKDSSISIDKDIKKNLSQEDAGEDFKSDNKNLKSTKDAKLSKEEEETEEALPTDDVKYKDLEKQVNDAKKWGQQKNRQLINSKRKVSELASKLAEEGVIPEEDIKILLNSFDSIDDDDDQEEEIKENPFINIRQKIDNEFKTFKRYNKKSDADEKYEAFYSFFPMMSEKEQEESFNYLNDSEADVALDYIMTHGAELYETLFKGANEKGGILKYVKSLQTKLDKLEKKSKELESELDTTTKKVYNSSKDSESTSLANRASTAEAFYKQRYQI
jgi:hypothetical protein